MLVVVIAIAVVAAIFIIKGQNEKKRAEEAKEALTNYINVDLAALESAKDQLSNQVNGAANGGWDYNQGSIEAEMNNAIEMSRQLLADANEVAALLASGDKELASVHNIYVEFAAKCASAVEKMAESVTGDYMAEGEEVRWVRSFISLMEEAQALYEQFQQALKDLADERGGSYRTSSELPFEGMLEYMNYVLENYY